MVYKMRLNHIVEQKTEMRVAMTNAAGFGGSVDNSGLPAL